MPKICKKCNSSFPYSKKIDGKIRNFGNRKFCLDCSPFGSHNTRTLKITQTHKVCSDCKEEKELSQFYYKTSGYPYCYCKSCMSKRRVSYYKNNKRKAVIYKGGACQACGYAKCDAALEFHHRNPEEKDFSFSRFKGVSIEKVKPELDKCVLLCANCHRETHQGLHTW
jgi:5-methylcytosine-specific restriction endonuclease McrA